MIVSEILEHPAYKFPLQALRVYMRREGVPFPPLNDTVRTERRLHRRDKRTVFRFMFEGDALGSFWTVEPFGGEWDGTYYRVRGPVGHGWQTVYMDELVGYER